MKRIFLLLVSCRMLLVPYSFSQSIGIGTTTPNASSVLDIRSTNKGLLIPRMTTLEVTSISNPAKGLMVYDSIKNQLMINMGSTVSPDWQTVVFKSGWSLNGNSGNNLSEFIGTTDNRPFIIRVNNQPAGRIDTSTKGNTFLGFQSGGSSTGLFNTAIGQWSLFSNTLGKNNTAIGESALYNNTIGDSNVAIGSNAMASSVALVGGIAIGKDAMRFCYSTPTRFVIYNIAIGNQAMMGSPNPGSNSNSDNIAIGHESLRNITTGYSNTAVGNSTLRSNGSGSYNTAIGTRALGSNSDGDDNTATGGFALINNTVGNRNSAFGYGTLLVNTTGSDNMAAGAEALLNNSTGSYNTAIGVTSLRSNQIGPYNTATGYDALFANTSGGYNAALGSSSLRTNTSGDYNTAVGSVALFNNVTGNVNTAIGSYALVHNINSYNTGVGAYALQNTQNSQYNTAIGYVAGDGFDNGYNNVFVGANTDVNGSGWFNVIAMGQGTIVTSGSSTARFGNSATVSYGGWAGWSNISDGRFKKDVEENVPGIDFINKLRPVTYHLAATELDAFLHKNDTNQISPNAKQWHEKALIDKEKIRYSGFVAQEVEAAAKELGFDFSGVDAAKNENDTYGLRYAEFVVPLVKAVQELSKQNDELKKQNEELVKRIEKLELLLARKNN